MTVFIEYLDNTRSETFRIPPSPPIHNTSSVMALSPNWMNARDGRSLTDGTGRLAGQADELIGVRYGGTAADALSNRADTARAAVEIPEPDYSGSLDTRTSALRRPCCAAPSSDAVTVHHQRQQDTRTCLGSWDRRGDSSVLASLGARRPRASAPLPHCRARDLRRRSVGPAGAGTPGTGTGTTVNPSIPAKSLGLHVYTGSPFARAVAAIITS